MYVDDEKILVSAAFLGGDKVSVAGVEKKRWASAKIKKERDVSGLLKGRMMLAKFSVDNSQSEELLTLKDARNLSFEDPQPSLIKSSMHSFLSFGTASCTISEDRCSIFVATGNGVIKASFSSPVDKSSLESGRILLVESSNPPVETPFGAELLECNVEVLVANPPGVRIGVPTQESAVELEFE